MISLLIFELLVRSSSFLFLSLIQLCDLSFQIVIDHLHQWKVILHIAYIVITYQSKVHATRLRNHCQCKPKFTSSLDVGLTWDVLNGLSFSFELIIDWLNWPCCVWKGNCEFMRKFYNWFSSEPSWHKKTCHKRKSIDSIQNPHLIFKVFSHLSNCFVCVFHTWLQGKRVNW